MDSLVSRIRSARLDLGMTQSELAGRAAVSLATVQNIEAGRANPSLGTLERILTCLALRLETTALRPDWEALIEHGLPLAGGRSGRIRPSARSLRPLLERGILACRDGQWMDERETEAFAALMLALAHGYPSLFSAWFRRCSLAANVLPEAPTGRVIKLKRLADRALSEYL